MTDSIMLDRIDEAHRQLRRFLGEPYESAAYAYLAAQVEIAARPNRLPRNLNQKGND